MESQSPQVTETQTPSGLNTESAGMITPTKSSPADNQVQEWLEIGTDFLTKIYDYIGEFVSENQKLLVNLLLAFLAIVAVKLILAILAAINDIPLLAPMFELVGLGYTGWFVYRYMLTKSSRQELVQEFEALKSQVVGKE
ncbi:MAG: CAAD domain-containing protein [Pleurocapsa sp.]